jgi:hypothetical protein
MIVDLRDADIVADRAERRQLTSAAVGGLLDDYHHTAASVLDAHVDAGGCCAACSAHWPCRPACSAAFALEL